MEEKKSFSGSVGFVLAAAGSAVGLGNLWRFPYLAAKNGGGLFLVTYLVLVLTFGFTLLVSEVSIGRKTKKSPLRAYGAIHPKWKWIGLFAVIVPFLILPYYCVIGGWVLKYCRVYLTGGGALLRGLDQRLTKKINIPFHVSEAPLRAVARGTCIALKNTDKFKFLLR